MQFGIWADGGPNRGYGHLIRTRTLARELLERGHDVTYLTRTPESVRSVCERDFAVVELPDDAPETITAAADMAERDALVVDHGTLSIEVQSALSAAFPLGLILDDAGGTVDCDLVVNSHLYASPEAYDWVGAEPRWCVGGRYHVLDAELRRFTEREPEWNELPQRALVTMGGSDVGNATPAAMRAFDGTALSVDVVVGPGFQNRSAIADAASETDATFEVVRDPDDLAARMFRADVAVAGLGLTAYELLAMRTPFVGVPQAPDQRPKAAELRERDAAVVLGEDATATDVATAVSTLLADTSLRRSLFERGRELVGGDGTHLVCDHLEELA